MERILRSDWLRGAYGCTDRCMDQAMFSQSKPYQFDLILVYFCGHITKILSYESSVHTGNICSDIQGAWALLGAVHTS